MHDVFLAPLEFASNSFLERLRGELNKLFTSQVKFLNIAIDLESTYSKERNQFYSTAIIAQAAERASEIKGNIILLLQSDLYVPVLTYVFGEAQLNGNLSVVSFCRLHEEFYTGVSNENLLLQRVLKEVLHELGHNYGLFHCRNWECVMHSSSGIEEVDVKGDFFCNSCVSAIKILK